MDTERGNVPVEFILRYLGTFLKLLRLTSSWKSSSEEDTRGCARWLLARLDDTMASFAHSLLILITLLVVAALPALSFSHDSHGAMSTTLLTTRAPWTVWTATRTSTVRPNVRADAAAAAAMPMLTRLHAKPVSGVGGMKNKSGRAKTGVEAKKNVPSKKKGSPESNIDWGKLIVAFLTPWVSNAASSTALCELFSCSFAEKSQFHPALSTHCCFNIRKVLGEQCCSMKSLSRMGQKQYAAQCFICL